MTELLRHLEIIEITSGVGAFIVTPDGYFLTIEEGETKRQTGKIKGMRSLPMETVEPGETFQEALVRAINDEEVQAPELNNFVTEQKLCQIQNTPGVWLHVYLIRVPTPFALQEGNAPDALHPKWMHIHEVLSSKTEERAFRPGTREVIVSYIDLITNGSTHSPQIYFRCQDEVPQKIFDALE